MKDYYGDILIKVHAPRERIENDEYELSNELAEVQAEIEDVFRKYPQFRIEIKEG